MKVPYAEKWRKETDKLRKIVLDCDLTEDLKWAGLMSSTSYRFSVANAPKIATLATAHCPKRP